VWIPKSITFKIDYQAFAGTNAFCTALYKNCSKLMTQNAFAEITTIKAQGGLPKHRGKPPIFFWAAFPDAHYAMFRQLCPLLRRAFGRLIDSIFCRTFV
jgi:hypothetical protein